MEQTKEIIDIINSIPKENLNYAMKIYKEFSLKYDDGIYINDEGERKFLLPTIIKIPFNSIIDDIDDKYFDSLYNFFEKNYTIGEELMFKTDLFLQLMKVKTKPYFNVKKGDEIFKKGTYKELLGLTGEFVLDTDKTKKDLLFDLINIYLSEYIKKIIFLRVYIIYTILLILEDHNYEIDNESIFDLINKELKENFNQ